MNGVYHRPSRPISQKHVGIPPRDPERVEMQASMYSTVAEGVEEREEEERQCEREGDILMIPEQV